MQSVNLGPFIYSTSTLLFIFSTAGAFFLGNRIGRRIGVAPEPALWIVLAVALIAGRLSFVLRYQDIFALAPVRILDIRDGGFDFLVGLAATLLTASLIFVRRRNLRIPLAWAMLAWGALWAGGTGALALSEEPRRIPDVELTTQDGTAVRLAGFSGKPMVVSLWSTWCPPCRREMPVIQEAQRKNPDIVFVLADQGETAEAVRRYIKTEGMALENVFLDPDRRVGAAIGTAGVPVNLFFDASGRLVKACLGSVSAPMLAHLIETLRDSR